jgi:tetratricopeptide (TPR) repeat protein
LNNQHKSAIEDYDQAISLNPEFHEAFHHRALSKIVLGDTATALMDFNQAIELREDIAVYYDDLGFIQMKTKNTKDAIKNFGKAVKLNPEMGIAFLHRAQSKLELGQTKSSCPDLESAAGLGIKEAKELMEIHCLKETKEEPAKPEEDAKK